MTRGERLSMLRERAYPYAGGLVLGAIALVWYDRAAKAFTVTGLEFGELVGSTFDIMITLTAFLFSVFVLAVAPGGGFLEKIFHTGTFAVFRRYVIEALVLGSLSALFCVPFTAAKPGAFIWSHPLLQTAWFAIAVMAILAFFRVVHIFLMWVGIDARSRRRHRAS